MWGGDVGKGNNGVGERCRSMDEGNVDSLLSLDGIVNCRNVGASQGDCDCVWLVSTGGEVNRCKARA